MSDTYKREPEDPYQELDPDEVHTPDGTVTEVMRQDDPEQAEDEPAPEPVLGRVVNAPTHPNDGGFENRVTAPAHAPADKTAGANASMAANAFEQRVTQEQGSH